MRQDKTTNKIPKERLDRLVFLRGFSESRERAKALILSGAVIVDGRKLDKAGTFIKVDASIELLGSALHPFVSRGGIKLEAALNEFAIDVSGMVAMDVGASTGGFTDCLLKRGVVRVYAVDVGYGQLAWSLRQDERVLVLERQNIRFISEDQIPEELDLVVIDVSFISLEKVIPSITAWMKADGILLALIKPQFEVGKGEVGRGGIVRSVEKREAVVKRIYAMARTWGLKAMASMESPIRGQKGNVEYLIYFQREIAE